MGQVLVKGKEIVKGKVTAQRVHDDVRTQQRASESQALCVVNVPSRPSTSNSVLVHLSESFSSFVETRVPGVFVAQNELPEVCSPHPLDAIADAFLLRF